MMEFSHTDDVKWMENNKLKELITMNMNVVWICPMQFKYFETEN